MIAVVVAHPDDEVLSFGSGLNALADRGVPLVLISLTNRENATRATEFRGVAEAIGALAVMLDYPDGGSACIPFDLPGFDAALGGCGVTPNDLSLVITHSPTGNERHHPQHVQAWRAVRSWAGRHRLPIGFFSESDLDELVVARPQDLAAGVDRARARLSVPALARACTLAVIQPAARRGAGLRARLAQLKLCAGTYARVRFRYRFTVASERKNALLELYPSQISGMREYASFATSRDILYAFEGAAEALSREARWHSS